MKSHTKSVQWLQHSWLALLPAHVTASTVHVQTHANDAPPAAVPAAVKVAADPAVAAPAPAVPGMLYTLHSLQPLLYLLFDHRWEDGGSWRMLCC